MKIESLSPDEIERPLPWSNPPPLLFWNLEYPHTPWGPLDRPFRKERALKLVPRQAGLGYVGHTRRRRHTNNFVLRMRDV